MAESYNFDEHFINSQSFKKGFNELNALMNSSMQELQEYINVMNQLLKIEKARQAEIRKSAKILQTETLANEKALKSDTNALKENTDAMRKLAKENEKSAKQIEELRKKLKAANDALKAQNNTKKESNDTDSKAAKLKQKLIDLDSEQTKETILLNEQVKQKTKALRDEAKASVENANAYKVLTKQVNEAQAEFKRLAAEFGVNSAEAKEARVEFDRLDDKLREVNDAAKDGRRDVGRYRIATAELVEEVKKARINFNELSAQFGENSEEAKEASKKLDDLKQKLADLVDVTEESTKATEEQKKAFDNAKKAADKFGSAAKALAGATVIIKIIEGFASAFSRNSEAAASFDKVIGAIAATFDVLVNRGLKAFPILQKGFSTFFESVKTGFTKFSLNAELAFEKVTNVFGRNDAKIKELEKSILALGNGGLETGDVWEQLKKVFAGTGDEIEKNIEKSNKLIDTTLAYRKQIIALERDMNSRLSNQAKLQDAADNENNTLQDRIKSQKELIIATNEINDLEENVARKREELAAMNANLNKNNIDAQEQYAQATANLIAVQIQNEQEHLAQKRELATLERDQIEQNLDFLIDDFDNRKTINERNIANEKLSYKERNALLLENQKLAEESYKVQTEELSKRLTEQGKAQIDFDALVKESSSARIAQIVRDAGLDEALNTRVLEIIRERRTVLQDLKETQDELNDSSQESFELIEDNILLERTLLELKKEGVDTEKVLEKLDEKRLEKKIQNLEFELALVDKNSEEEIKLKNELNNALLQQTTNRIKSEEELEQKKFESRKAAQEGLVDLFVSSENKRIDKIKDVQKQERARYLLMIKQFVLEQALAKLRLKLGDSTAQNDIESNQNSLISNAIGGLGALLGGFKDGGYTGLGHNFRDNTGDRVAGLVHENEYVVPTNILKNNIASQMVASLEMFRKTKNEKHLLDIPQKQLSKALETKLVSNQTIIQNNFNAREIAQELAKVLPKSDIQETVNGVIVRQKVGNNEREYLVNAKKSIVPKF